MPFTGICREERNSPDSPGQCTRHLGDKMKRWVRWVRVSPLLVFYA